MKSFESLAQISLSGDKGYFCGYASVFNIKDSHNDIIKPGAFAHSIATMEKAGKMPKMLWQHQHHHPIGMWTLIEEDSKGLYVEGQLLLDLVLAREAYTLMQAKALDGLSIGYNVVEGLKSKSCGREILRLNLHEISVVTFPSNCYSQITKVKNI